MSQMNLRPRLLAGTLPPASVTSAAILDNATDAGNRPQGLPPEQAVGQAVPAGN
jgi:hypothetical protein